MKSALITGANKSIGFETARQLLGEGFLVYLGCRKLENGLAAATKLKNEGLKNVRALQIDVNNQESVDNAQREIEKNMEALDVLINNAGISGGMPQSALGSSVDLFKKVYETNVYGVIRVTQAFIELLKKSTEPRIVNVSSSQGSLTLATDESNKYYHYKGAVYQSSKSALNMYSINLAYELRETLVKVNMVDPGFTKTDFNNNLGTGTTEDAAKRIIKYALIDNDGPTGKFFSEEFYPETGECPW